ncbi:MAG: hypothetical protein OYL41_11715 [Acidobacteriota bacterium]|nr:hypothetical protein [Acidobacteriota bacterium]
MLDVVKIRHFYFHPPPDDPEHESTPEELWASAERQEVEECLLRGGDPRAEGLGEHGSLIGGPVKPARCFGFNPEKRLPRNPLPLSRFDHPRARATPPATPENPGRGAPEAAKVSSPVINKQIRAMPGRQGRRKQLSPAGTSGPPAADRR